MQQLFQTYYINPLINNDFPDPSVIAIEGKGYFAYGTHDAFSPTINNILVSHSWDLVNWSEPEGALIESPSWAKTCERFWAPHVIKVKNEYRLYYAADPDTHDGMCLAMAVSKTPFNFRDIGAPIVRKTGTQYTMIDPCLFVDPKTGRHYLYYGSAHEPIRVIEVETDGKTFKTKPEDILFPETDVPFEKLREGAYITYNKKFDRYFLYVSGHNTWAEKSYAVGVFWSNNPVSEFKKIPGQHLILQPNDYWDSPGQNCIITDAIGNEWMLYHAVDVNDKHIPGTKIFLRKLCMDKILYTKDGWPYIPSYSPSYKKQIGPVVNITNDIAENFRGKPL